MAKIKGLGQAYRYIGYRIGGNIKMCGESDTWLLMPCQYHAIAMSIGTCRKIPRGDYITYHIISNIGDRIGVNVCKSGEVIPQWPRDPIPR